MIDWKNWQQELINKVGWDGIAHCAISGWLVFIIYTITGNILYANGITLLIGYGKEQYDLYIKHTEFSMKDLTADAVGVFISSIVLFVFRVG